jgi:hypothetical protein
MRYTATVVELESALRSLPCDNILNKGNLLCKVLEQTRKLDAMPEIVVRELLLGLLRIPRYTPVPWIEDNAILALPVSVLTYAVLYTFR